MGMARIFGLCAAFLFASPVAAAVTIDLGPSDYRNFGSNGAHTGGGIRSSIGGVVRMPPGGSLSITRNPVIPYGSVGGAMRSIGRATPGAILASAGMSALFAAMDWVFDEGQWKASDLESSDDLYGYYFVSMGGEAPTVAEACDLGVGLPGYANGEVVNITFNAGGTSGVCVYQRTVGSGTNSYAWSRRGGGCLEGYTFMAPPAITGNAGCYRTALVPLTDSHYSELTGRLPALPAGDVAGAAGDAQRQIGSPLPGYHDTQITGPSSVTGPSTTSTSTDPVTGDTTVTETSTQTYINYGDTTITTTNTTTSTTYQNGEKTGETVTTEAPGDLPVSSGGGGAAGDWPGFCDWATVVCDWFDWTREDPPPEQDLPAVVDDDFFEEKNISFGAKSCPPDHEINLAPFLATSVGVSFQPLCDFAGLIYYMVMAASYIIAAYIMIGVARNA